MTPPKCPCYCPLCDYPYKYMGKHLQSRHFVKNAKEKRLLTNFATGRVNFRHLSCPVPGCGFSKTRLDRHLEQGHPELDGEKLAELIKGIKRKVTIDSLRALRASDPSPPLVSNLDVGDDEEEMMVDNAEAISDDGVPSTSCSSCQKKSAEITELWRKLRNKERLIKKAKAIIASMSEELRKAKIGPGVESEAEASGGLLPDSEEEDSSAAEEPPKPSDPVLSVLNAYKEFPSSILQYMEQYWVHLKGSMGTRKHIENQKSKVGRVMMFFKFMTEGRSVLPNWTFLENIRRIHEWPEHLYGEQKAITTIKLYLVNVLEFLTFFRETPPSTARVSKKSLVAVVRAISCDLRRLAKRVVLRQMQVKKKKVVNLIPKEDLRACQKSARRRIPMLLEALRLLPCPNVKRKFFGYFGAYCASLYGHRTGVLTNMCVGEVDEARAEAELGHDGFVINVKEHKTAVHGLRACTAVPDY
ncbi:uncharacterized protein LOC129368304 isoform X2 [Poeciliopsis prolifica]|nr:uncharacterized protein LOC129368304 isoform X2 [Poeciliopsis prolifica]